MKVKRAWKTELKPNNTQKNLLARHCGAARFAYNWGLARKVESYQLTGKSPGAIDLRRELNALKKSELPWLYEVSKCAPQEALRDLDSAFRSFFRRCELKRQGKLKGKAGYPRFKSRRNGLGSFRLTGSIHVKKDRVKLPRLGWIRLKERGYLPTASDTLHIMSATVSERAGRWFVSLQIEEEKPGPVAASGSVVGIDLGVKTLAACSYGLVEHVHYENPKALHSGARKLKRLQKKLSRQEKGSTRRDITKKKIARQHYRISCVRSDAIHKATSSVVAKAKPRSQRPSLIGIEDLNVSGMMKNRRLAKAVADASMREFRRQIAYKCAWYGIELVVVPRFEATSKSCSVCGWVKEDLKLSDRTFICEACGHTADRDDNASDNIRLLAVSSTERINGRGGDVRPLYPEGRMPEKRQSDEVA
ncbi:MAG: RNA-guided endonuclease InsQ/TnpB family protein [Candidatus Geothermincolia bacterium]